MVNLIYVLFEFIFILLFKLGEVIIFYKLQVF